VLGAECELNMRSNFWFDRRAKTEWIEPPLFAYPKFSLVPKQGFICGDFPLLYILTTLGEKIHGLTQGRA
jgi:hypothetical protein